MIARPAELENLAATVREAIRQELRASSGRLIFKVWNVVRRGGLLDMDLESLDGRTFLDESLTDADLSWEGEIQGGAEMIAVLPELSLASAFLTRGRPPKSGSQIEISPPRYLKSLLDVWNHPDLAPKLAAWNFERMSNSETWPFEIPRDGFPGLLAAQARSFDLPRWKTSFLWGPPGTGKTYTVGRMIASYVVHHPGDRVLLLSSTNVAVDLLILEIDKALKELELEPAVLPTCYRFGSSFDPARFSSRKHLIPLRDKTLVDRLGKHMTVIPDLADAERYHLWKRHRDELREAIRHENKEFLGRTRVAAMTTTLAAYDFCALGKFDLVVFDEASQIGKAQAMTFAHLGRRVLFAGDPKQLSPIAQSETPEVERWLGTSPFGWIDLTRHQPALCELDEQRRMAPSIGDAVSSLFYESELRVADSLANDAKWKADRIVKSTRLLTTESLVLVRTNARAEPARKFRGYECARSAELVAAIVADHVLSWSIEKQESEIQVLTPYRAQRRMIEDALRDIGVGVMIVSTVHRAQGSERRIVIFDPVCPTAEFVSGAEGERLMNVAFSRAQCRLVVLLQDGWEKNRVLLELSKRSIPVTLDEHEVSRLQLEKLGRAKVEREMPAIIANTPTETGRSPAEDLLEDFREELRKRGAPGLSRREVTNLAMQITDKAKFCKVSLADREALVVEFSSTALTRKAGQ